MLSEFQKKKISQLFRFFDADGNNTVEAEDMDIIVENFAKIFNWEMGDENSRNFGSAFKKYWRKLMMVSDTNNDDKISLAEFLQAYERTLVNDNTYEQFVKPFLDNLFPLIDIDKDGNLQLNEFTKLYQGFRNPAESAQMVFNLLDVNGDGVLSREEVYQHFYDFHFSQDAAKPANAFFGTIK